MKLIDGRSKFNKSLDKFLHSGVWVQTARARSIPVPVLTNISTDNPVVVHISHGRILASCPNCNNGEYVWKDTPLTICANCGNSDIDGKMRRVLYPTDFEEIERLLLLRTNPANQNWFLGITVEQLKEDNIKHGIGV